MDERRAQRLDGARVDSRNALSLAHVQQSRGQPGFPSLQAAGWRLPRFVIGPPRLRHIPDVQTSMKHELSHVVNSPAAHASLIVDSDRWDLYVFGVTPVGRDMFLQLALIGPRICTVTVRARAPIGNISTARGVLAVVRDWIESSHDDADQAYLELAVVSELAS